MQDDSIRTKVIFLNSYATEAFFKITVRKWNIKHIGICNKLDLTGIALCSFVIGGNDCQCLMIRLTSKIPSAKISAHAGSSTVYR